MESNDKLYYDKLDLEPFTFSSPNSTGLNDLDFRNLLENAVKAVHIEKDIPKDSTPLEGEILVELFVNDSEVFSQLPQNEAIHLGNKMTALQPDWKQPLPLPKPKIEQTDSKGFSSLQQNEFILKSNSVMNKTTLQQDVNQSKTNMKQTKKNSKLHSYLHLLLQNGNIQAYPNANAFLRPHNMINKQPSTTLNNHSSKPVQKIKIQQKSDLLHLVSILKQTKPTLPIPQTKFHSNELLIHLIGQLNKQQKNY